MRFDARAPSPRSPRAAVFYLLVASCRLCRVDAFACLRDTIGQACQPGFQDSASLPLGREVPPPHPANPMTPAKPSRGALTGLCFHRPGPGTPDMDLPGRVRTG